MKVIILRGLPASGKTTWAKRYQKSHPNTKRVNRDELRAMLDDSVWSKENEEFVVAQEEFLIEMALLDENDVIIDDTNLAPKTMKRWMKLIEEHNQVQHLCDNHIVEVEVKDFTTSLAECIRRDSNREGRAHVGKGVIQNFYNNHYKDGKYYDKTNTKTKK